MALAAGAELAAWSDAVRRAAWRAATGSPVRVHVKFDTGMGRLGTRESAEALAVAERVLGAVGARAGRAR